MRIKQAEKASEAMELNMHNTTIQTTGLTQLDQFLTDASATVHAGKSDWWVVEEITDYLGQLVSETNWLPEGYCTPQPGCSYSQYPLYIEPNGAFCVTAVAFGPSMVTPIHNHTVWGVIGIYRGLECERRYARLRHPEGSDQAYLVEDARGDFKPGMVSGFTAPDRDIHSIETTPLGSVSIHVYGADIARVPRLNFDRVTGRSSVIYSSYAELPELVAQAPV